MKVQDLATHFGKSTKAFIEMLGSNGISVRSGSTKLDSDQEKKIRQLFEKNNTLQADVQAPAEETSTIVEIDGFDSITLSELATKINVKISDILRVVLQKGKLLNLNSEIDLETAQDIALGCHIELSVSSDAQKSASKGQGLRSKLDKIEEDEIEYSSDLLITRPPVVTIMGHVDHGKTKLLDAIRQTNVVDKEAGGITQHIGAYQVTVKNRKVTFLDTPGHAAFTTLRARGAQVTDIAILVVAADEGVKPQTLEALHHAQAANVQIIVALNKIDKPGADIEQVKQQLSQHGLVPEEWGGKIVMVPVSAKTNAGIDELLDMILITGDMMELQANPTGPAKGVIIESRLSRQKGPVATLLIKSGVIQIGDFFVIESIYGKVRALLDDNGKPIQSAGPGTPVELLGISEVPTPGEILEVYETEKLCKIIVEERQFYKKAQSVGAGRPVSFEQFSQEAGIGAGRTLNLIVKADVNGSLEAIIASINMISTENAAVQILHSATGEISENDIMLAKASSAIIIGFGVSINPEAQRIADEEKLEVKLYTIIYQIVDDIKKSLSGLFTVEYEDVKVGQAEVRQVFSFSKVGKIAGSYITEGKATNHSSVCLYRGGKEFYRGKIVSLKRFKDDVKEVLTGFECGIVLDDFHQMEPGDIFYFFEQREKIRK